MWLVATVMHAAVLECMLPLNTRKSDATNFLLVDHILKNKTKFGINKTNIILAYSGWRSLGPVGKV